eukprot:8154120-Karenia_brevis.AAC.1
MERRARVGMTFPKNKTGVNQKADYNVALGEEFDAMSEYAANVVPEKTITVQNRVRVRLMMEAHWAEMQACAVHRNAAPLYRTIRDTRSQ